MERVKSEQRQIFVPEKIEIRLRGTDSIYEKPTLPKPRK